MRYIFENEYSNNQQQGRANYSKYSKWMKTILRRVINLSLVPIYEGKYISLLLIKSSAIR